MEGGGLEVIRVPGLVEALENSSRSGDFVLDIGAGAFATRVDGSLTDCASSGDVMDLEGERSASFRGFR